MTPTYLPVLAQLHRPLFFPSSAALITLIRRRPARIEGPSANLLRASPSRRAAGAMPSADGRRDVIDLTVDVENSIGPQWRDERPRRHLAPGRPEVIDVDEYQRNQYATVANSMPLLGLISSTLLRPMTSTSNLISRAPRPTWHERPSRRRNAIDVRGFLPGFQEILAHASGRRAFGSLERLNEANQFPPFALAHPVNFRHPDMNFELAAFTIGREPTPPPPPPPAPSYPSPPPAREGFTRSLQESDAPVCPNCEQELGVGEDDMQRQVWIVRSCGHV